MKRRRRILAGLILVAAILAAGWLGVREVLYSSHLPPAVKERMPGHWRMPWGLKPEVRAAIDDLYSGDAHTRTAAADRLANFGPDAASAAPFLVALLADDEQTAGAVFLGLPPSPPPQPTPSVIDRITAYLWPPPPTSPGGEPYPLPPRDIDYSPAGDIAAYSLADIGGPAVEPTIAALKDPKPRVRYRAAMALGLIADRRATPPLIAVLQGDPQRPVRVRAAEALGLIGDARAVPALLADLQSKQICDFKTVMEALGRIGDPRAVEPVQNLQASNFVSAIDDEGFRSARCEVLLRCGDAGTRAVLANLLEPGKGYSAQLFMAGDIAAAARNGYRTDDPRIIQVLLRALEEEYNTPGAQEALAILRPASAVEPLLKMLSHPVMSDERQTAVAETLGHFDDPRIADALAASLSGPEPRPDRRVVAMALARLGDRRAVPLLAADAAGDDEGVLSKLAGALGRLKTDESTLLLIKMLGDPHDAVFLHALEAISDRGDARAAPSILARLRLLEPGQTAYLDNQSDVASRGPSIVSDALVAIGRPVAPLLVPHMTDGNLAVRQGVAAVLGRIGGPQTLEAAEPLIAAIPGLPPSILKATAIETLGRLKNPQANDAIIKQWRTDASTAAGHAVDPLTEEDPSGWGGYYREALLRAGDPRGLRAWRNSPKPPDPARHVGFGHGDERAEFDVETFISGFGHGDIESLAQAIREQSPKTSLPICPAAALLMMMDDPDAGRALSEATAAQPWVRGLAAEGIAFSSKSATTRRVLSSVALHDADRMNRFKALALLISCGDPQDRRIVEQVAAGDRSATLRYLAKWWIHIYYDTPKPLAPEGGPKSFFYGVVIPDPYSDISWQPDPPPETAP